MRFNMTEVELLKVIDRGVRNNDTSLDLSGQNIKTIPHAIAKLTKSPLHGSKYNFVNRAGN
jgi:hypothetical protein